METKDREGRARACGADPAGYFRDMVACIADHPISRITELLPWNVAQATKPE